ncbi:MAG: cyclic nucleotide-binding domain-containing protein [Candidatus Competibacteraceae bacterium]|jgi:CRP-like cAMP-binding protein|nr:cyclic nucleotide-binding domain-containing protein [Candidatus Competibacteraceae bacterium]
MRVHKTGAELVGSLDNFRKIPFLQSFGEDHLKELLNASKMIIYEPDEIIIAEGGFDDKMFILLSGKVKVIKNKAWIATFEDAGELFGELSMLDGEARSAAVIAVEKSWCLAISIAFLHKLSTEERNACYAVLYGVLAKIIAERLKLANEELVVAQKELEYVRTQLVQQNKT